MWALIMANGLHKIRRLSAVVFNAVVRLHILTRVLFFLVMDQEYALQPRYHGRLELVTSNHWIDQRTGIVVNRYQL
jgi:hypothetical protein